MKYLLAMTLFVSCAGCATAPHSSVPGLKGKPRIQINGDVHRQQPVTEPMPESGRSATDQNGEGK